MQDEPDPRRHPRTVMATDTEWQRIRERAEAAGMSISRFICQRAAGPERRPPPGVAPEAVLARRLCCKPDIGVSQIRTTTVLSSCFCVGQTVL